ncbi:MAG: ABC transporter substrate-binding protein [Candidatus Dormibacteraeota bacterium]|nr:ABC transporter substrate-binding protein [Candidatus Dormibacteraeota bacterium]
MESSSRPARSSRWGRLRAAPLLIGGLVLAACSGATGSSGSSGGASGPMLVGVIAPFTGADAGLGPAYFAACLPATRSINAAGGAGGHQLSCQQFDTRGEPADAVPAASQMLASHSNLMTVVGCTSDEASSVVPVIDRAHIPMFCMTGQSEFNKSNFKYFHRLVPPDEFDAYAMVGSALYHNSHKNVALVFGNDIGSQAFVQPAKTALEKLGGKVTITQAIALGQPSYRTEVTQMLATHPDVIFTEALGSTDATYLAEVKQLNGKSIPFIGTSATVDPVWFAAVRDAIGVDDLVQNYQAVDIGTTFSGPGYQEFLTNLNASASQFADAPKYKQRASTLHLYDGIVLTALAIDTANSSDPKVYNAKIKDVANGVSGATVVHTYKEGADAIKAGKHVRFVGAGGETNFNEFNNSQQGYILVKYDAQGNEVTIGQLSQQQTQQIINAGGG